jgi:hypothetical protein
MYVMHGSVATEERSGAECARTGVLRNYWVRDELTPLRDPRRAVA